MKSLAPPDPGPYPPSGAGEGTSDPAQRLPAPRVRFLTFDFLLLLLVVAVVTLVTVGMGGAEAMLAFARHHEQYELEKLITAALAGTLALTVYAWRSSLALVRAVEERRHVEAEMRHLAMHDPLTGLPNRNYFAERMVQELARARREGRHVGVFALDLDNFKHVNDVYGHGTGDELLIAVGERLRTIVRQADTVARLGGDEFAVIQGSLERPEDASSLARRIVAEIARPFELRGHPFVTSTSVGIALSTDERADAEELLRAADVALYGAKEEGRSTYRFFDLAMDEQLRDRKALERALRRALAEEAFELHYQPLYTVRDRTLFGFEALIRWNDAERGFVSPGSFIPVAEEVGLIQPIGEWVLRTACRAASHWPEPLSVAVNVSPIQFRDRSLPKKVAEALDAAGLAPGRLELEVTESVLMQDTDSALGTLAALRALGVRISMDDFGTGYSSLSYLRKFPFDKIKIDRAFVSELDRNPDDAAIVRAVVAMGRSLGMVTLAEGIESAAQLERLCLEGCEQAQGYHLGRPMPEARVRQLLREGPEAAGVARAS